ncbi:PAS domain-containing protein [Nostoc sp. CHAB 5824]|nr:PAS domain-containing protein [Nostoc sp. CHAB 5824]
MHQVLHDYLEGCTPVFELELRMLTKSGEWKWILACGKVFQWE